MENTHDRELSQHDLAAHAGMTEIAMDVDSQKKRGRDVEDGSSKPLTSDSVVMKKLRQVLALMEGLEQVGHEKNSLWGCSNEKEAVPENRSQDSDWGRESRMNAQTLPIQTMMAILR